MMGSMNFLLQGGFKCEVQQACGNIHRQFMYQVKRVQQGV
jgi:hypothetical protein